MEKKPYKFFWHAQPPMQGCSLVCRILQPPFFENCTIILFEFSCFFLSQIPICRFLFSNFPRFRSFNFRHFFTVHRKWPFILSLFGLMKKKRLETPDILIQLSKKNREIKLKIQIFLHEYIQRHSLGKATNYTEI